MTWKNKDIVTICNINKLFPIKWEFRKKFSIGKTQITIEKRAKDNLWGRFGGGWNWKLGVQVGSSGTVIINWLVGSIQIRRKK